MKKKTFLFQFMQWLSVLICITIAGTRHTTLSFIIGGVVACVCVGILEIPRFRAEMVEKGVIDKIERELKNENEREVTQTQKLDADK